MPVVARPQSWHRLLCLAAPRAHWVRLFALVGVATTLLILLGGPAWLGCAAAGGCGDLHRRFGGSVLDSRLLSVGALIAFAGVFSFSFSRRLVVRRWLRYSALFGGALGLALLALQLYTGLLCHYCIVADASAIIIAVASLREDIHISIKGTWAISPLGWIALGLTAAAIPGAWAATRPTASALLLDWMKERSTQAVLFSDFACPHCRDLHHSLQRLYPNGLKSSELERVYCNHDGNPLSHLALVARAAAVIVGTQDRFDSYLFASPLCKESIAAAYSLCTGREMSDESRPDAQQLALLAQAKALQEAADINGFPTLMTATSRVAGRCDDGTLRNIIEHQGTPTQPPAHNRLHRMVPLLGAIVASLIILFTARRQE